MNPRERMLAVVNHQVPDRTPTEGWFHDEVVKKLKAHYKTDDWEIILDELGVEQHGWAGPRIVFPAF